MLGDKAARDFNLISLSKDSKLECLLLWQHKEFQHRFLSTLILDYRESDSA
jgi:hypothetical protein